MSEVSDRFAVLVRQLRESRGWSQERLANCARLNRSYMGEIERATAMPSLATAGKLAHALEMPLSELILRCEALAPVQASDSEAAKFEMPSIAGRFTPGTIRNFLT